MQFGTLFAEHGHYRNLLRESQATGWGVMEDSHEYSVCERRTARQCTLYRHLYVQVLAAIIAGMLIGHFWPDFGASLKPLGDAFIKLVKMIIAPVIFLTVATGIAGMSDLKKVGRVAGKAMIYFLCFSTLALIVGMVVGNILQPGAA